MVFNPEQGLNELYSEEFKRNGREGTKAMAKALGVKLPEYEAPKNPRSVKIGNVRVVTCEPGKEYEYVKSKKTDHWVLSMQSEAQQEKILKKFLERKTVTGREIAKHVARKHGLTWGNMLSKRRLKELVLARQEAMYLMREYTPLSLVQIGRILGDLDHTTVLYGANKHAERMSDGKV